ncbi:TonB-linked SusC/RagA family outer membrane protein [Mucilaginibacter sp. SG538B]|uniref:TonB-dependent receptor n=1 Tax=Mucilaginibacter sp. SG538B TaxID=2587021 RepID=UPI00159DEE66|nr:TonB-dependent receptor [Mucilaginibacter sp. SG538B]NVM63418.1 TonB-linked SusC/RagA family outer membrane protein [Mucilaginibacter sp. SG538B]
MERILFSRRLILPFIFLLLVTRYSAVQAQGTGPITLKKANISLADVFKSIKKQTGLTVFYSNTLLNDKELVTVDFKNAELKEVFGVLLKGKNLNYVVRDQLVVIEKSEPASVVNPPKKEPAGAVVPKKVQGIVSDDKGLTLPGVSVKVKGTMNGTQSDMDGKYTLNLKEGGGSIIVFSFVGSKSQEFDLANYSPSAGGVYKINVQMGADKNGLEEVTVVAYGTQKKASLVSSITSINPKQLKGPSSNLTTMLAGVVPGMISYQRSGEPGADNAQFFIRGVGTFGAGKVDPLILIDGIEMGTTDLARLQPDDISGFSVLKDATASSLYGARGANGVILVTTKRGETGAVKFNIRGENSTSSNVKNIDLADNISYMTLANEAVLTRNPLGILPYSQNKIDHTAKGDDPLLYPSNNWIKQLIKTKTNNQRFNMNASGGSEKAKYYLAMTYNIDNGNLAENSLNNFSNNIKLQSYSLLSNTTLNLTKTTEAVVSLKGQFDSYHGPIGGGGYTFLNALWSNPVAFPAIYPGNLLPYVNHPLFGNAIIPGGGLYMNPYAQSLSGFQSSNTSTLTAQLSLSQKLDFITQGLSARAMAYTTRYSYFTVSRQYSPYYYQSDVVNGTFNGLTLLNNGLAGSSIGNTPTEYLTYNQDPALNVSNSIAYIETAVTYNRTFAQKHAVSGLLIGTMRNYLTGNAKTLQLSLPSRNQGVSGRFTYGYDNRYLFEFNFGYNGSERFASNHRFGFFPSVGAGWVVSNEKFFEPLLSTIDNLKFRVTYGLVGNDQIGKPEDRFFYLSDVSLNNGAYGQFGTNYLYSRPGVATRRYENQNITWEQSRQTNLGMDLTVAKNFTLTVDAYQQKRDNILMVRSTIPTSMGLQADISSNAGKSSSKGVDIAMDYKKNFNNSFWIQSRGTLTYAKSKLLKNEEPVYPNNLQYLSKVGNSLSQIYGLIAERLFIDNVEVANSPVQSFGDYKAGDIKYRDMNGDGKITSSDIVPIGYPQVPEIIYGFGFSVGYKNFDISAFFQGSARSSFVINSADISPFYLVSGLQNNGLNTGNQSGLLKSIADDHWSEDNRNPYAFWPRLSNTIQANNSATPNSPTSTWWLRNGSFLRLKSAELGYNFNKSQLKFIHLNSARIYLNGLNLLTFSSFKLWDPEMGTSGLGYPIQKVFNVGLRVEF